MNIAKKIDHTILKADATKKEIETICNEAITYDFFSVCVNSCHVPFVRELLMGTDVKITSVVGFPLGAMDTKAKAYEAKTAVSNGANEIDMVINIGKLKDQEYSYVTNDIKSVVKAVGKKTKVKVILETCLLTEDEIVKACELAKKANAHFVKTSTGFSQGGATIDDVKLMKDTVGNYLEVKASGGVRTYSDAIKMLHAGASRIGASASVNIVKNVQGENEDTY